MLIVETPKAETLRDNPKARAVSQISQALRAIDPRHLQLGEPRVADEPTVEIRPINSAEELDTVYRLTYNAYRERGYCQPQPDGRLIHYPHLDHISETTVLVAVVDGEIVGTNSWTADGPAGLHADRDFKVECDAVRREGRRLGASWRIATQNACRNERKVVMQLIEATVHEMVQAGVQTALFTFNPRHERIYQRLLNMRTIARSEGTHGLSNAPAVLMRLDAEEVPARWLRQ